MNNLITIENLTNRYGHKLVFDNLSLSIASGKVIGLLGENGVGKSTLIRIIADLCKPDKGTVMVKGKPVSLQTHSEVSFMLELSNLYPWMRVLEAINYYSDMFPDFNRDKAFALCEQLNLNTKEYIMQLSRGNQERVLLMLAISRKVPLYLLDEPVAGLDPRMKKSIIQILLANIEEESTVLIASHLLRDLEEIFDEIMILGKNKVITQNADDIRENYHQSIEDYYMEVTQNV
jgi:ABC-2 type transport system ATP-binding protein